MARSTAVARSGSAIATLAPEASARPATSRSRQAAAGWVASRPLRSRDALAPSLEAVREDQVATRGVLDRVQAPEVVEPTDPGLDDHHLGHRPALEHA